MNYSGKLIEGTDRIEREYAPFLHDEARINPAIPELLFFPETTAETAQAVRQCMLENRSVTVSGGRTGIGGGAVPSDKSSAVVSLERIQPPVSLARDNADDSWYARAGAGLKLQDLLTVLTKKRYSSDQDAPDGLFFPVDPTETSATLGGMAATNASGARTLYYGAMRKWVRGVTVVLADGSVLKLTRGCYVRNKETGILTIPADTEASNGTEQYEIPIRPINIPATKHTAGYYLAENTDAVDLFIGSEGTLGIITELELNLTLPGRENLYTVLFMSHDNPVRLVETLTNAPNLPAVAMEYMDSASIDLLRQFRNEQGEASGVPELPEKTEAALYLEYNFESEKSKRNGIERLAALLRSAGVSPDSTWAGFSNRTLTDMKKFRHALPERINSIIASRKQSIPELTKIGTDMAVPLKQLGAMLDEYRTTFREEKLDFCIFGHIGNGHVHVNILPETKTEMEKGWKAYMELARSVRQKEGSICAEHGIGRLKRKLLPIQFTKEEIACMKEVKNILDPEGRLNPEVLFS